MELRINSLISKFAVLNSLISKLVVLTYISSTLMTRRNECDLTVN